MAEFRDEPKRESGRWDTGVRGREGRGRRWPATDGGWVKRGDGARMETAETERRRESERKWAEGGNEDRTSGKDEVSAGADERTLTSYYLLIANSFSLVAY